MAVWRRRIEEHLYQRQIAVREIEGYGQSGGIYVSETISNTRDRKQWTDMITNTT